MVIFASPKVSHVAPLVRATMANGPFAERQVRGDDDGCPLIETADQMKEQLAAGLSEGQVAIPPLSSRLSR